MTGERFVRTSAIRAAVKGHETTILAAVGIKLNGSAHIRCPFPDHDDANPSFRWDLDKARAHCTCTNGHALNIFDVIGRMQAIDFDAVKIKAAELLGRADLIEEKGSAKTDYLKPPSDQAEPSLPRAYLAHRLGVEPDQAPVPTTPTAGWTKLSYWDPPADKGSKPQLFGEFPCAVFGTVAPDGRTHAHRIYVAPDGRGKAELDGRDPKKSAPGKAGGCAVIFGDRDVAPWLLLAEGIETAAAIAYAFRAEIEAGEAYVAAGIAAPGVGSFDPWPATTRVTVCADRDEAKRKSGAGYRAGENAAMRFAERHQGKIGVAIALPGLLGGSVDWLDILLRDGADAVRAAVEVAERPRFHPNDRPEERKAERPSRRYTLDEVHEVFRRWLGDEYDLDTLNAVLATAASEKLPGDPLWLLLISGPGNAKTETVQSLVGAGAHVTSTIASEGALLSATAKKGVVKDATGGLLRALGDRGLLVIKDVTSILSANRDARAAVLAALREVYDGHWERNVGTDGGRSLTWRGRLVVVGAVTTAWDTAHSVVATMGDRFVTVRADSHSGRLMAGRRAMNNTGSEAEMRGAMADAVGGLIEAVDDQGAVDLTDDEQECILQAANLVTLVRTGVEFDYRGDVIDAHQPEMPTRFAKQLVQMFRGAVAIGVDRPAALALAIRCARDSVPPLRLELLQDVAAHRGARLMDIRRRVGKPRATVDRNLQALHILRLLACEEEEEIRAGKLVQVRLYTFNPDFDLDVLSVTRFVGRYGTRGKGREGEELREEVAEGGLHTPTNKSGYAANGAGNDPERQHVGTCDHCRTDVFADNMVRTESGALLHFPCVQPWRDQR